MTVVGETTRVVGKVSVRGATVVQANSSEWRRTATNVYRFAPGLLGSLYPVYPVTGGLDCIRENFCNTWQADLGLTRQEPGDPATFG